MTHEESIKMCTVAYRLLVSFQQAIDNQLEGDHPDAVEVERWLSLYEDHEKDGLAFKPTIEGHPV